MQIMKIYSVYDKKAAAYRYPHFALQNGVAIRDFGDAVNDPKSEVSRHSADFCLYLLGEYNDSTGEIKALSNPQPLEEAINLKATENK